MRLTRRAARLVRRSCAGPEKPIGFRTTACRRREDGPSRSTPPPKEEQAWARGRIVLNRENPFEPCVSVRLRTLNRLNPPGAIDPQRITIVRSDVCRFGIRHDVPAAPQAAAAALQRGMQRVTVAHSLERGEVGTIRGRRELRQSEQFGSTVVF